MFFSPQHICYENEYLPDSDILYRENLNIASNFRIIISFLCHVISLSINTVCMAVIILLFTIGIHQQINSMLITYMHYYILKPLQAFNYQKYKDLPSIYVHVHILNHVIANDIIIIIGDTKIVKSIKCFRIVHTAFKKPC